MHQTSRRAGTYITQPTNYRAFVPAALPPNPPIRMDDEMWTLLSNADRALGRLDGSTEALPNPDLFVLMYVRKEAVLSAQIEGTLASLAEVLELEAQVLDASKPSDAVEVVNYIDAMNHGLARLEELPVSLRLIREIHAKVIDATRGAEKSPGEFRTTQNWIGASGSSLTTARFVPPPPHDMRILLGDLERFVHDETPMPSLVKVGLAHAQFETIHPFLDGNGRVGRLLITFLLCERRILQRPLLYLSITSSRIERSTTTVSKRCGTTATGKAGSSSSCAGSMKWPRRRPRPHARSWAYANGTVNSLSTREAGPQER